MNPCWTRDAVERIRSAESAEALRAVFSDVCARLGFTHWSIILRHPNGLGIADIKHNNYPAEWIEQLGRGYLQMHDPVLAILERTARPFWWDDLPDLIDLTDQQAAWLERVAATGIRHILSIPHHIPGEPSALCTFAVAQERGRPEAVEASAMFLSSWAVDQARRIRDAADGNTTKLDPFTRDVLRLTARGFRPGTIALLLDVRRADVVNAMTRLKRKRRASSAIELVVRAVHEGQIRTHELLW